MSFLPDDQPTPNPAAYAVYVRIALYVFSTVFAMIPLSWSSWVAYDAATQMLHISVEGMAAAVGMGLVSAWAIFRKWGVK